MYENGGFSLSGSHLYQDILKQFVLDEAFKSSKYDHHINTLLVLCKASFFTSYNVVMANKISICNDSVHDIWMVKFAICLSPSS